MKRKLSILTLLAIITVSLIFPASISAATYTKQVEDHADFLTTEQEKVLSDRLSDIKKEYDMDIVIVTEKTLTRNTIEAEADDIYDYNDYGVGSNNSGILFLVCESPRKTHFTTTGNAITAVNDKGLEYLTNKCIPLLKEDDYYNAFLAYADGCEFLFEQYAKGEPYTGSEEKINIIFVILAIVLIPLAVSFIITKIRTSKMKTAREQNYAQNYVKDGSFNLAFSRDIFLYSHTDRRAKPKSDDHSTTHTSSSGETHGGSSSDY